jgi:DNA-binding NtrC family response regulator
MHVAPRVLLAEDDDDVREALARGLRQDGHEVIEVPNGDGVKAYIEECVVADAACPRVHVLVTDLRMPGMNGLSLLSYIQQLGWELPTVVVTAFGDEDTRELAEKFGAHAILDKPVELEVLRKAVRSALGERWAVARQAQSLH